MTVVKTVVDIGHDGMMGTRIFSAEILIVFLSKSFGYALRGILYVAAVRAEKHKVQTEEIAEQLSVPRHFLGKVMQKVVKAEILQSTKGPYGGFSVTKITLHVTLMNLVEITDGVEHFNICALQLRNCSEQHPCPLHIQMDSIKKKLIKVLSETTIEELLSDDKKNFIDSLSIPGR